MRESIIKRTLGSNQKLVTLYYYYLHKYVHVCVWLNQDCDELCTLLVGLRVIIDCRSDPGPTLIVQHSQLNLSFLTNVTEVAKTDLMGTNTEIHFLAEDESHTHALSRDTKHLRLGGQVCFYRRLFSDAVKPRGCISWPVWPLRGINKTAWGAKLILTAGLAYPVSCAILGHLLRAQHCHLRLSVCFSPPLASHPPHLPPPPSRPPTPYRLNPWYYSSLKNCLKN